MGFSVSASTAIVFAGLFLAFGIFYPAAVNGYERVTEAQQTSMDAALNEKNGDTAIASASLDTGTDTLTVDVDNTGSTTFYVDEVDLVVGGEYIPRGQFDSTEVDGNPDTNLWQPGTTLTIDYTDSSIQSGDRVVIITEHGIRDSVTL
ncbi:flagellin [Halonotius terrestris]|uniref:Flagellin n=1 Tax=Halonotius terrestris TaxID=2487750 RepID=A0A8J8P7G2_9EURY|nr:flagellin [Halonotius terrestris]TQQ81025.1 flagellin [Halonotius terrestris]